MGRLICVARYKNLRKMSGGFEALKAQEADITKMLAATTHLGSDNSDVQMEQYIFKRRQDGVNIINLKKTWEKLMLAARAIAAIENPADVFVVSSRPYGQRAVLKFARYIGATAIAGRYTPGAFTNQIQAAFREPRLLVVADPRADHQPVTEASYANIPVIAFCNVDSPVRFLDFVVPSQENFLGMSCPIFSVIAILKKRKRKNNVKRLLKMLLKLQLLPILLLRSKRLLGEAK